MKLITIIGARPQFVKAAALSRVILPDGEIEEIIVHTGQHFDHNMNEVFFKEMSIPSPAYNLGIKGGGHGSMTGQMLVKLEEVLLKERPDAVMVYGDTNSTLAGALAAKKLLIPLIHVEAGLRSYNMSMPEEVNRVLTDRISDLLFCPTKVAYDNLAKEGFEEFEAEIFVSGDVMLDVALWFEKISDARVRVGDIVREPDYVLATIHRAENTDNEEIIANIVNAFNQISASGIEVVVPIHPRTRKIIAEKNLPCQFRLIEPVGYLEMIQLIKHSALVMTDSGGLQKEAYFFKKNCVTLRNETEWVELVDHGYNYIAGNNTLSILNAFEIMSRRKGGFKEAFYGDGKSAELIVNQIKRYITSG